MEGNGIIKPALGIIGSENNPDIQEKKKLNEHQERIKELLSQFTLEGLGLSSEEKSLLDQYQLAKGFGIVTIFHYPILEKMNLIGNFFRSDYYRTLPLCMVVKAGPDFVFDGYQDEHGEIVGEKMEPGMIFTIKDVVGMSILNPKNTAYHNNEMSESSAEQLGDQPSRWIHNIHKFWADSGFIINKIKLSSSIRDSFTFKIQCGHADMLIKDRDEYLKIMIENC